MTHDFDWDDIRVFLAASRADTLTQAARLLQVSQPTVGRRLKALEDKLGTPLFERLPDHLELTEAGRALLPYANEMERQSLDLSRALDGLTQNAERVVRVTAIASVALLLTRSFAEIEAQCAPAMIELIDTGERLNLARQEADIAFRMNSVPSRGDLVCRRVGRIAYALYASQGYAARLPADDADAVEKARFVGYRANPRKRSQSSWLYAFGRAGQFPLRLNNLHLRYEAARLGVGITLLPCYLGDGCAELTRVRPPFDELTEDIYLLMHETTRAQPVVRRVADALVGFIEGEQERLLGEADAP